MRCYNTSDDKIINVLLNVKEMYGDTIFTDKRRLDNILKDLLIGEVTYADCKGKIAAFTHAIDEHAYDELNQHKESPEKTQKYYINMLRRTYNDAVAIFVVNALSALIGIKPVLTNNTKTSTGIRPTPSLIVTNNPIQTIGDAGPVKVLTETEAKKLAGARITIPDTYTAIGYHAFSARTNLESITIPNSITRISKEAFYQCKKLTTINIPDNTVYISKNAFTLCENLSAINVSEKNKHFTSQDGILFNKNKTALLYYPPGIRHNTYTVPLTVIHIADKAFYNRKKLTTINIPSNVTSIGESTFCNCTNLTKINLPNTITRIRRFTFSNCKALTRIIIPNSVTIIGERAFAGCTKMAHITISDNVTKLGNNIFEYTKITVSCTKNSPIYNYCLKNNIKTKIIGISTQPIPTTNTTNIQQTPNTSTSGSIERIKVLTEDEAKNLLGPHIIIPPIYNEIGSYAFRSRVDLERVTIHSGITNINGNAFCGCTSLSAIFVSEKNQQYTSTKGGLFATNGILFDKNKTTLVCYPAGLKKNSYTIPNGVMHIGEFAFFSCKKLKSVTFPKSVVRICESAFYQCKELSSVTIPGSVVRVSMASFSGCKKLKSVTIFNGVLHIDESAFDGCEKLKNVALPKSMVSIGKSAFRQCVELSSVIIPNGVSRIDSDTFSGCKKLKNVTVPDGVVHVGESAFEGCENLKNINLPKSVTVIGKSAFRHCKNLKNMSIPLGVTSIDEDTFAFCKNLRNIVVPDSVINIGNNAFQDISKLTISCSKHSFTYNYCLKNKIKIKNVYFVRK